MTKTTKKSKLNEENTLLNKSKTYSSYIDNNDIFFVKILRPKERILKFYAQKKNPLADVDPLSQNIKDELEIEIELKTCHISSQMDCMWIQQK